MTSPRHTNAVENLREILEERVSEDIFSIRLEADYPREFEYGADDEIWSDMDLLVRGDDFAHIYEVKTGLSVLGKGFGQLRKAEGFLEDQDYSVASKIVVTDENYQKFNSVLSELGWWFDKEEFEEVWPGDYEHEIHLVSGSNLIKDFTDLASESEPIEPRQYPIFDYQGMLERGLVRRNGSGFLRTKKFEELELRIEEEDRTIYHVTPRNENVCYLDLDDYRD